MELGIRSVLCASDAAGKNPFFCAGGSSSVDFETNSVNHYFAITACCFRKLWKDVVEYAHAAPADKATIQSSVTIPDNRI